MSIRTRDSRIRIDTAMMNTIDTSTTSLIPGTSRTRTRTRIYRSRIRTRISPISIIGIGISAATRYGLLKRALHGSRRAGDVLSDAGNRVTAR